MKSIKKGPNILFILVDALRAKNLGCYGYPRPTSPNIDKIAKQSVLFESAFSCINTTEPSLTTIFSGRYPISHGIVGHGERVKQKDIERFSGSGINLLPEILKSKGYTTLAVDWLGRWHRRGYDYYSGILRPHKLRPHTFLMYSLINRLPTKQQMSLYSLTRLAYSISERKIIDNAKIVTDRAIHLIKESMGKEFFLFVHYWDIHAPYSSPPYYVEKFIDYDYGSDQSIEELLNQFDPRFRKFVNSHLPIDSMNVNEVLARYDGAIAFVDHEIGRIMMALRELEISERTCIVLTSDHGESLTEHGIYFDHHGLYDVSIHVPLIFSYSEFPTKKKVSGLVQHVDIVPTILDVLNVKTKSLEFDGRSMMPLIMNEKRQLRSTVYAEEYWLERKRAVRTGHYKLIQANSEKDATCSGCGRIHGAVEELYDVNNDAEETQNLIKENPAEARRLKKKISEWVDFLEYKRQKLLEEPGGQRRGQSYSLQEEEDVKKRLKELGYF